MSDVGPAHEAVDRELQRGAAERRGQEQGRDELARGAARQPQPAPGEPSSLERERQLAGALGARARALRAQRVEQEAERAAPQLRRRVEAYSPSPVARGGRAGNAPPCPPRRSTRRPRLRGCGRRTRARASRRPRRRRRRSRGREGPERRRACRRRQSAVERRCRRAPARPAGAPGWSRSSSRARRRSTSRSRRAGRMGRAGVVGGVSFIAGPDDTPGPRPTRPGRLRPQALLVQLVGERDAHPGALVHAQRPCLALGVDAQLHASSGRDARTPRRRA